MGWEIQEEGRRKGEKSEREKTGRAEREREWVEAQVSGAYEETNVPNTNKIWIMVSGGNT